MIDYVDELRDRLVARWPQARMLVFGHVADNNIHLVVSTGAETMAQAKSIAQEVYRSVAARRGSISAEHGIGLDKSASLASESPPPVLQLIRHVKQWLDPDNLLNPGKVISP